MYVTNICRYFNYVTMSLPTCHVSLALDNLDLIYQSICHFIELNGLKRKSTCALNI